MANGHKTVMKKKVAETTMGPQNDPPHTIGDFVRHAGPDDYYYICLCHSKACLFSPGSFIIKCFKAYICLL